ncbi:MAG: SDR family NAD(P)-dependent oxidoreductase [Acidimicrobiia bacterium]
MDFVGKKIIVTGASSGIGAELAKQLAARGAIVAGVARRADRLDAVIAECAASTPASNSFVADLSDPEAASKLMLQIWDHYQGIDILINNAGMGMRKLLLEHTPGDIDSVLRTNLVGPIRMSQVLIPKMIAAGGGMIVNVASGGGRFGIPHESIYCASKFGLTGWSEVAAIELVDTPVQVKLIQPGAVESEIWDARSGEVSGMIGAEFISSAECARGIIEALGEPGVEHYVPKDLINIVEMRRGDEGMFFRMMADIGNQKFA